MADWRGKRQEKACNTEEEENFIGVIVIWFAQLNRAGQVCAAKYPKAVLHFGKTAPLNVIVLLVWNG